MITVLMSTYNGEKYLSEQIDSILAQKDVNVNILIRDDGSTDNTTMILERYANKFENINWYNGDNLGCGKSFYKLALDAPESDYFAFADQDDVWDEDKISTAVLKIRDKITIPALYCSAARPVDDTLQKLPVIENSKVNTEFGVLLTQSIAPGCSFVFNRELLHEFRSFGIENIDIHDWSLLRIAKAINGFIYYDLNPHFSYRQHGNNVIGYKRTFLEHWGGRLKRFRNKEYRKIRIRVARDIKRVYKDKMTDENLELISILIDYEYNNKSRLALLLSKKIRMIKLSDNIVFKVLIILNLV